MKITKSYLKQLIKEEIYKENEGRYNDLLPLIDFFKEEDDSEYLESLMPAYKRFVKNDSELVAAAESFAESHPTVADLKKFASENGLM